MCNPSNLLSLSVSLPLPLLSSILLVALFWFLFLLLLFSILSCICIPIHTYTNIYVCMHAFIYYIFIHTYAHKHIFVYPFSRVFFLSQNVVGLPSGWFTAQDQSTGLPYYFNEDTGEVSWDPPPRDQPSPDGSPTEPGMYEYQTPTPIDIIPSHTLSNCASPSLPPSAATQSPSPPPPRLAPDRPQQAGSAAPNSVPTEYSAVTALTPSAAAPPTILGSNGGPFAPTSSISALIAATPGEERAVPAGGWAVLPGLALPGLVLQGNYAEPLMRVQKKRGNQPPREPAFLPPSPKGSPPVHKGLVSSSSASNASRLVPAASTTTGMTSQSETRRVALIPPRTPIMDVKSLMSSSSSDPVAPRPSILPRVAFPPPPPGPTNNVADSEKSDNGDRTAADAGSSGRRGGPATTASTAISGIDSINGVAKEVNEGQRPSRENAVKSATNRTEGHGSASVLPPPDKGALAEKTGTLAQRGCQAKITDGRSGLHHPNSMSASLDSATSGPTRTVVPLSTLATGKETAPSPRSARQNFNNSNTAASTATPSAPATTDALPYSSLHTAAGSENPNPLVDAQPQPRPRPRPRVQSNVAQLPVANDGKASDDVARSCTVSAPRPRPRPRLSSHQPPSAIVKKPLVSSGSAEALLTSSTAQIGLGDPPRPPSRSVGRMPERAPPPPPSQGLPPSPPSSTTPAETFYALYAFETSAPDQLSLAVGDTVTVTYKRDGEWWYGALRSGASGWFPASLVTTSLVL